MLSQVGLWDPLRRDYLGARGARFVIFPGSALARTNPEWVMSSELVETSRLFARRNAAVTPEWIEQAAAHLVSRSYSEPHWSAKRGATVAVERVSLFGIPLVTGRTVDYGRIDPPLCRELFIRGALVEGQWSTRHRFWHTNAAALNEAADLEERSRRRGLVIDDEGLFGFYDARMPADITSVRHFDSWWKRTIHQTPDLLTLTPDDIRVPGEQLPDEGDFPLRWSAGPDVTLRLSYAFEPGDAADGVTVDVPLAVLPDLDPAEIPGAAPGLRGDLVTALLRSPTKAIRRQLGPAPNLVPAVLDAPELAEQPILEAVAAAVTRLTGIRVRPDDWDLTRVPMHLLPRYRVVDESGTGLGEGRDLAALQRRHAPDRAAMLARAAVDVTVSGATSWTFGFIPQTRSNGWCPASRSPVYPALVDRGRSVDLAVLADPGEAVARPPARCAPAGGPGRAEPRAPGARRAGHDRAADPGPLLPTVAPRLCSRTAPMPASTSCLPVFRFATSAPSQLQSPGSPSNCPGSTPLCSAGWSLRWGTPGRRNGRPTLSPRLWSRLPSPTCALSSFAWWVPARSRGSASNTCPTFFATCRRWHGVPRSCPTTPPPTHAGSRPPRPQSE